MVLVSIIFWWSYNYNSSIIITYLHPFSVAIFFVNNLSHFKILITYDFQFNVLPISIIPLSALAICGAAKNIPPTIAIIMIARLIFSYFVNLKV